MDEILTLKQTNKLNGIVIQTTTHDKIINAFPHVSESAFCSSSATKKREKNNRITKIHMKDAINFKSN